MLSKVKTDASNYLKKKRVKAKLYDVLNYTSMK